MNYSGNNHAGNKGIAQCQSCGYSGSEHTMGKCEICGAVYHLECWNQTGECRGYNCTSRSVIPLHKEGIHSESSPGPVEQSQAAVQAGILIGNQTRGALRNKIEDEHAHIAQYDSPASAELHKKVSSDVPLGSTFTQDYNRLDLDTPFEQLFLYGALLVLVMGTAAAVSDKGIDGVNEMNTVHYLGVNRGMLIDVGFLSLALIAVKFFTDFTYVIDNTKRQILYSRSILGFTWTWKVCSFHDVVSVGAAVISRRRRRWWGYSSHGTTRDYYYAVTIGLQSGHAIKVSEYFFTIGSARSLGVKLAHHFGVEYLKPCVDGGSLDVNELGLPLQKMDVAWRQPTLTGVPGYLDIIVLAGAVLVIVGASFV